MRRVVAILMLAVLLLLGGCTASLETLLIGYSMVSPEDTFRNTPASQNVWGPKYEKEKER